MIKDGEHGKDYFFSEEELKFYITNNYGWIGPQEDNPNKTSKHQKNLQSATLNTVLVKKELITKNEKKKKRSHKIIQYTFEKEIKQLFGNK